MYKNAMCKGENDLEVRLFYKLLVGVMVENLSYVFVKIILSEKKDQIFLLKRPCPIQTMNTNLLSVVESNYVNLLTFFQREFLDWIV